MMPNHDATIIIGTGQAGPGAAIGGCSGKVAIIKHKLLAAPASRHL